MSNSTTEPPKTMRVEYIPQKKKKPRLPIFVPITLLVAALVTVTVVFLAGGDAATGLARAGWTSLGVVGLCLLGALLATTLKRFVLGFNALSLLIIGAFFLAFGVSAVLTEGLVRDIQGDNYQKEGNYQQAVDEYHRGSESNLKTKIPQGYQLWGDSLLKSKQYEAAVDKYRKVSSPEFLPNKYDATAKKQVGAVFLAWGQDLENDGARYEDALTKYDVVVKDGNNPDAIELARYQAQGIIYRVGDNQLETGDYEKALAVYKSAVELYGASEADLKPYFSKVYLNWGRKLLNNGDYEGALQKLEPNLKLYPSGSEANLYNLAIVDCYVGIGKKLVADQKWDELRTRIGAALTTYGSYDSRNQLQSLLGDTITQDAIQAEAAKDYQKAIDSYEKALSYIGSQGNVKSDLTAKLISLHLTFGDQLVSQGQYDKAIAIYQRALQRYPNPATTASFRTALAKAYYNWGDQADKAGDYQAALDRFRLILGNYNDQVEYTKPASDAQPRLLYSLAGKLVNDKQYDTAQARYRELINSFGGSSYSADAKKLLDASQNVTVVVLDSNGKPVPNLKVKLDEDWTVSNGVYTPKGRSLDFTTNASGAFTVSLAPGNAWLFSYYKNGEYKTSFVGNTPAYTIKSSPLRATTINQGVNLP